MADDVYAKDRVYLRKLLARIREDTLVSGKRREQAAKTITALQSQLLQLREGTYAEKTK